MAAETNQWPEAQPGARHAGTMPALYRPLPFHGQERSGFADASGVIEPARAATHAQRRQREQPYGEAHSDGARPVQCRQQLHFYDLYNLYVGVLGTTPSGVRLPRRPRPKPAGSGVSGAIPG